MEACQVAHAHITQGIAMIGVMNGQKLRLPRLRLGALSPILEGHLESDFNRGRAIVGKENAIKAGRRQFDQPPCQANGRNIGQPQKGAMGHPIKLLSNRLIKLGNPMTVNVAPKG